MKYTPYLRAYTLRGEQQKSRVADLYRMPPAERAALQDLNLLDPRHLTGWLAALVQQGYAAIVIERPGTGASFGKADPTFPGAAREADQVLGWIAAQAWCNGRIGMWGHSWEGQTQLAAASTGNPHLKAIMPAATYMDAYGAFYRGGIYNRAFGQFFGWSNTILDTSIVTPVDSDADGSMLAQARAERGGATVGQTMTDARLRAFPFRDSELAPELRLWELPSPYPLLDQINAAGVAIYLVAGWYDIFTRDVFLLYRNLTVPKRLLVRPLDHSQIDAIAPDLDYGAEVQRWFDHWLKGIDTGITDEPAVRYYLLGDIRRAGAGDRRGGPVEDEGRRQAAAAREASEPESLEGVGGAAGDEDGGHAVDVSAIGPPDDVADDKAEDPAVDVGPDGAGEEVAVRIGQAVLKALESGGGLEQLMAAHQAVAAFHGNNYLPLLEAFYRSHRAVLFTLVDAIELEATSAGRGVLDALEFIRAVRHRRGEWIEETCVVDRGNEQVRVSIDINAFASEMWKRTLRDKRRPGMLARRHLEVCVFSHLAAELRSGDLAVAGSDSYASLHAQMMTWEECEAEVAGFCEQAGIPADAKTLAAFCKEKLTETAAAVDAGYPANADLRLEGGKPVLARRKGADRRPSAIILEGAILERLPDRSLLDILARSAHLTGWHRHFGPASGSDPKIRDTLGRYVVTAFACGGNLGPTEVARHMRGVSAHEIYTAGTSTPTPGASTRPLLTSSTRSQSWTWRGCGATAGPRLWMARRSRPGRTTSSRRPRSATAGSAGSPSG